MPPLENKPLDEIITDHSAPQPRIDTVKETAVTGENITRIFRAGLPLEHGLSRNHQSEPARRSPTRAARPARG